MKLSTKIILPIIIISALLILLAGCFGVPTDESPGYTPGTGTIIGTIAAPCCITSDGPVNETDCISPNYWCCYCQPPESWLLQDGIEVVLTYGEDEVATTTTNEDGEFTFTDLAPGKNYVVTAYCPDYSDRRPLVKDVALEVIDGDSFDTKITDLVSTSLGLVVDFLVYYTDWGPEDISLDEVIADQPLFIHFPKFKALIYEVRRVVENCELNLLTDDDVQYATCRAAEEISGLEIGCGAGFTAVPPPEPPPPSKYNLYLIADPWDGAKTLTGAGLYDEETLNVAVNTEAESCYEFLNWTVDVGDSSWVTGGLNTEPLEVDMYGNVTLTAHFACPVVDPNLVIDIGEVSKAITLNTSALKTILPDASICLPNCAIINSVTVNCDCTEGSVFPLVLVPPYDSSVLNIVDHDSTGEIGIDYSTGEICFIGDSANLPKTYTIDITYTNPCGDAVATGTVTVEFKDCSCIDPTVVADGPYAETVCPGTAATIDFDSTVTLGTGPFTYDWDFGDGSLHGTIADPSHTYPIGADVYNVTLVVTNACGDSTYNTTVTITESVAVTANAGPDQSEVVCPGANALIDLVGSGTGNGTLSYSWDFGDGGTTEDSTEQDPQDVAFGKGTYTVTLTVTDTCGSATDTMKVTISECINHAPYFTNLPPATTQKVNLWQTYTYDVNATDDDLDTLTFSLTTSPNGMEINSSTGVITWTCANCDGYLCSNYSLDVKSEGTRCYKLCDIDVTVRVTSGGCCGPLFDEESFKVEVWQP